MHIGGDQLLRVNLVDHKTPCWVSSTRMSRKERSEDTHLHSPERTLRTVECSTTGPSISKALFRKYWEQKHRSSHYQHLPLATEFVSLLSRVFGGCRGFVLDHGCGSGRVALELARMGLSVGLNDISNLAIKEALNALKNSRLEKQVVHRFRGELYRWDGPVPWGGFLSHRVLHTMPPATCELTVK